MHGLTFGTGQRNARNRGTPLRSGSARRPPYSVRLVIVRPNTTDHRLSSILLLVFGHGRGFGTISNASLR